ncbi:MAG: methylated-DNA--[protein]-cysteine S-methyltransferase [Sterolibacterium sp.]|nr:methylated-DNA--[protein]-cysteine S-methyltransferase [Sterolibacterium sp.]
MIAKPQPPTTYQAILAAPGFNLGVACSEDEIVEIEFLPPGPELAPANLLAHETVRQLRLWLQDARYTFSLPLAAAGTPFQRKVWAQISAIPCSQTRSYGDLAAAIGSAPRAVGGACGANPYPLVVPCHRVVAKDGGLGGFNRERGGFLLDVKRWLLAHENPDSR